jgi:hypothetical protein
MRAMLVVLVIVAAAIATAYKGFTNALSDKLNYSSPSFHSSTARLMGVFVAPVVANPKEISVEGRPIRIGDAWIEKRYKRAFFLIWFPYNQIKDGYNLCFTITGDTRVFQNQIHWYRRGSGNSFTSINRSELFYETFPNVPDSVSASVSSGERSKLSDYVTFTTQK